MGNKGIRMRLVWKWKERENGACGSILSWKSTELMVHNGHSIEYFEQRHEAFKSLQEPIVFAIIFFP